ncbi:MAG: ferrochelatase [Pseudomonadaceae bacterium]|nr:ferrochelatase [Pseudomonadaceae bacterium]
MTDQSQTAQLIQTDTDLSDTGIVIVNLGTPASTSAKDVSAYLNEFLMDGYVIRLPWPLRRLLVSLILRSRPEESAKAYRKIWRNREPGSPLLHYGQRLRDAMRAETDVRVELAMRYGQPSIESAMTRLKEAGVRRVVLAPLYPQHADSTVTTTIAAARRSLPVGASLTVLPPFYNEAWFVERFASILTKHLPERWDHLLFSYHGLPEAHLKIADPGKHCLRSNDCCEVANPAHAICYRHQVRVSTQKIAAAMGLSADQYSQSFQSRLGRAKWLEPYTDATLVELARGGVKHLAVACPAFVADNLETLEEIAMAGKETFLNAGGETLTLLPSLNADRQWASSLLAACLQAVD